MQVIRPAGAPPEALAAAAARLRSARKAVALTGAGVSVASGIPDFRSAGGLWTVFSPDEYATLEVFHRDPAKAWELYRALGRTLLGRSPNPAHHALAEMERQGLIQGIITQNVDNLHQRAGHSAVIDLHGNLVRVICLGCAAVFDREAVQAQIAAAHPHWRPAAARAAPDGDADLDDASLVGFTAPACLHCGGILKPDVVFFGENVPAERVQQACDTLADCDALLVIGSSLLVYSGYRFARQAAAAGQPIALLTLGRTRADDLAHFKWDVDCQTVLGNL